MLVNIIFCSKICCPFFVGQKRENLRNYFLFRGCLWKTENFPLPFIRLFNYLKYEVSNFSLYCYNFLHFIYCHHSPSVTAYLLFHNEKNLEVICWEQLFEQCAEWTALQLRTSYLAVVPVVHICLTHAGGVDVPKIYFSEFFEHFKIITVLCDWKLKNSNIGKIFNNTFAAEKTKQYLFSQWGSKCLATWNVYETTANRFSQLVHKSVYKFSLQTAEHQSIKCPSNSWRVKTN